MFLKNQMMMKNHFGLILLYYQMYLMSLMKLISQQHHLYQLYLMSLR
jgi:hypothetical protein